MDTILYTVKLTSGDIIRYFDGEWMLTLEPGAYAFTRRTNRDIVHYPLSNVLSMSEERLGYVPADKEDKK